MSRPTNKPWFYALGARLLPGAVAVVLLLGSRAAVSKQSAVQGDWTLTTWTIEDGLPSNVVRDIVRTADGFLWLATMGGLVRFDGARFKVYDAVELSGLNSPRFTTLEVDRAGRMWAGIARHDSLSYDGERWSWHPAISTPSTIAAEPGGGVLFGGYWGAGRWLDGRFEQFTRRWTAALAIDREGRIWGGSGEGIFRIHESGAELVDDSVVVWSMEALPEGGIAVHGEGRTTLFPSGVQKDMGALEGETIWSRAIDGENNHWFGTSAGLFRLSHEEWSAEPVVLRAENLVVPPPMLVKAIFPDRNGRVWLGSEARGLHLLQPRFVELLDALHVVPAADESVWAITHEQSVVQLRDGEVLERPPMGKVTAIRRGPSGALWLVNLLDGASEAWRCQRGRCEPVLRPAFLERSMSPIYEEATGTLLQGFLGETVRFDGDRALVRFPGKWLGTTSGGTTWFGRLDTLARERAGRLDVVPFPDGIDAVEFYSVHEDSRGYVWISTYGHGLWLLRGEQIHRLTTASGLPSNMLGAILEDEREQLWINSNRGVFVASIERLVRAADVPGYRVPTTLATSLEMVGAIPGYQGPGGTLFFSSIEGAVAIDPRITGEIEDPPATKIDLLRSGDVLVTAGDRVELPVGARSFEVQFTAAYLQLTVSPWFRYRLEPSDEGWIEAGDQRSAHYAALNPGAYRFIVQARNEAEEWGDADTLLVVLPARFYETGWFRGLVLVLFGAALLTIYISQRRLIRTRGAALRSEKSKHRAEAAARRLSQRLGDAEETVRRRIAQELHDDVSQRLVLLALQLGRRSENEHLVEMTRELASDVHRVSHDLHPAKLKQGLGSALRDLVSRQDQFETSMELSGNVDSLLGDEALCLYRVAQETLHNALRHSRAGNVKLELVVAEKEVRMSIKDDGIGFELDTSARDGLGLDGMADRVQGVGGEFTVDSRPGGGTCVMVRLSLGRR